MSTILLLDSMQSFKRKDMEPSQTSVTGSTRRSMHYLHLLAIDPRIGEDKDTEIGVSSRSRNYCGLSITISKEK